MMITLTMEMWLRARAAEATPEFCRSEDCPIGQAIRSLDPLADWKVSPTYAISNIRRLKKLAPDVAFLVTLFDTPEVMAPPALPITLEAFADEDWP